MLKPHQEKESSSHPDINIRNPPDILTASILANITHMMKHFI